MFPRQSVNSAAHHTVTMKNFLVFAFLIGCALCVNLDRLFRSYAGDSVMSQDEMAKFWMHFDTNDDGNVTKAEFDSTWRQEDLGDEERAPFFFIELDRVADEVLNQNDYPHIFRLFDEDGNGGVTESEFRFNWQGLFDN